MVIKKKVRILGIDPGTAIVGWGVIVDDGQAVQMEAYGCIETSKHKTDAERLKEVADDLAKVIDLYRPDEVAIEELFFFKNLKTVIKVAQARGVLVLVSCNKHCQVFEYTPLQVKQALTGYGRADKNQVQLMVKGILKLKMIPRPDDAADALAIALCHHQSRRMGAL